jgi:hypothetical protein
MPPTEPFDEFIDGVLLQCHPYGVTITFNRGHTSPTEQGTPPVQVGKIRMTVEHAKAMLFMSWRQIKGLEDELSVTHEVADKVLGEHQIDKPSWDAFWNDQAPDPGNDSSEDDRIEELEKELAALKS